MKNLVAYMVAAGCLLGGVSSFAATLEVGAGKAYSDIQTAIDAAVEGQDEVLVYDGTYAIADSLVLEKGITLRSVNGSGSTIVTNTFVVPKAPSKQEVHRCIVISNDVAVVQGFTFAGGYLYDGGTTRTGPDGFGAGVYLHAGKLLGSMVTHCRMGKSKCGGALAMMSMTAFVSNCVITANESLPEGYGYEVNGVGLYAVAGEIVDSEISDNIYKGSTYPRGGGAYVANSGDNKITVTMRRCKIIRNKCIKGNYVNYWGAPGGLYAGGRNSLYENLLIAENETVCNGGGVYCGFSEYTPHKFVNCTIVNNKAAHGGGVFDGNGYGRFYNCIIQGNSDDDAETLSPQFNTTAVGCAYCLSPVDLSKTTKLTLGGNLQGSATFKAGTYELAAGSAGYDAGSTSGFAWLETTVDLNHDARIWNLDQGGKVDIGCYEYSVKGLDVSITSSHAETNFIEGTSVRYTCNVMPAGSSYTCVWKVDGVAAGTDETLDVTFTTLGAHKIELIVTDSGSTPYEATPVGTFVYPKTLYVVEAAKHPGHVPVSPYITPSGAATNIADAIAAAGDGSTIHVEAGDYPISSELVVEKGLRLLAGNGREETVVRRLSGNTRLLNLSHVNAVVSGFTFRDGNYNGAPTSGGGVLIRAGGTLTNCAVVGCNLYATQGNYGAGVFMQNGLVVDCDITDNTNAVHDTNYKNGYGGGVRIQNGEVRNCRILRNVMTTNNGNDNHCQPGGGVYMSGGKLIGCLVADNACRGAGGGIYAEDQSTVISNVTVVGNVAHTAGGICYSDSWRAPSPKTAVFCNSAVAANLSTLGSQYVDPKDAVIATYSFGPEGELPAGEGNVFGTDARFKNAQYVPSARSPLVNAGVYADWMAGAKDLRGEPRVSPSGKVTIGCYQVNPAGLILLVR